MLPSYQKTLPYFQFHLFQKFSDELIHAVLSRNGGASEPPFDTLNVSFTVNDKNEHVKRNREIIAGAFGLPLKNLISTHQIHGKRALIIDKDLLGMHQDNDDIADLDALITNVPEVALMIKVADCQAILMFDPVKKVVAAVHAGWKGLVQDISGETLSIMKEHFQVNPANVLVGVSPSLGPCCAYFSNPELELPVEFKPYISRDNRVDLWQFSIDQLKKHGVAQEHIELARVCTMCGAGGKFFSFRRDRGVTGRFGALVYLKGDEKATS